MQSHTTVNIVKVYLFEQPIEQHMQHRDLSVNMSAKNLNNLEGVLHEATHTQANSNTVMKDLTSDLITISAPKHDILLPNHQYNRLAGCIIANIDGIYGNRREVLHFYTDYAGYNSHGQLDPEMCLWFSSAQVTTYSRVANGNGGTNYVGRQVSNVDILSSTDPNVTYTAARPSDILQRIPLQEAFSDTDYVSPSSFYNGNSSITNGALSNRSNNDLTKYGYNVVKSYLQAETNIGGIEDWNSSFNTGVGFSGNQDIYDSAAGLLKEESVNSLELVKYFRNNFSYLTNTNFIQVKDLFTLRPDIDGDGCYVLTQLEPNAPTNLNDVNNSWNNNLIETSIAYELSHSIPAYLTSQALVSWSFIASSQQLGMHLPNHVNGDVSTTHIASLVDNNAINGYVTSLHEGNILETIRSIMARYNCFDFVVSIDCSMFRQCKMSIIAGGNPPVNLSIPNYCSNLTTPCITADTENLALFSDSLNQAIITCSNAINTPMDMSVGNNFNY